VFSVLVSNTYATPAASQGATLSITAAPIAPTITQHPASVSVNAGSAASFSVGAIGSAPLAYQWRRNGVDIAGATSASFQLASATAGDNAALFSVEVRNAAGAATSQAATLTVTGANPDIADLLRTRNCLACHDTDGKLLGPSWAEIASRYGGQTDSETYLVDRIRQGGRGVWGLIPMPPNPQVDEAEALTLARWFIAGAGIAITPPVITQHPISRSVQVGATASFSVIASGSAPMRYQWRRNGVDIAGATGPSYTTPATTIADNGARFSVVVGNPHTAQAISQEAVLSTSSTAGTYPDASITLVVPYAAGGATDVLARRLATALAKQFGQQVVVSNVGGAGGTLGAAAVAKAAADGYTLLLTDTSMATASALYRTLAFDPTTDFEYLGLIDEMPLAMLGKAGLPADNYAQLASWMQANAGNFVFANAGLGSPSDLCALAFQAATGVAGLNVPYKGSGPALTDLLGGQIDLFCDQVSSVASHVRAGQAKTYGVTSSQRVALAALSGVPTLAESGLAGFYVTRWHGLYAPRGTPRAVLDLVNAALARALADTDFVSSEQALGSFIVNDGRSAPAGHLSFVQSEIDKWGPLLKTRGQWSD
jgi:tripartite-type tricarboxylate transporter receptor subunit TctC/cytochrome c551/c552